MLDLIRGLPERGYRPLVALKTPGDFGAALDEAGVPWFPIHTHRWIGRRRSPYRQAQRRIEDLVTARRVARLVRSQNVGIVHTNTLSSPVGAFIASRLGAAHVWHMREAVDTAEGSGFVYGQRASARLIRRTSCVVACSQHVVERTARYADPRRLRLLYDGVLDAEEAARPLSDRAPLSPDRPVRLLLVSKIGRRKAQHDAVEALGRLRARGLDARLTLIGDGNETYASRLRESARRLGFADALDFPGYVDPWAYYQACDISLMCGPREPLSRVAIESQAAGIPCVAVRSGGLPEVVEHRATGWLYEEGSPEDLADKIEEAVRTPPCVVREMTREGRRRAYERFNTTRCHDEAAALYRELGVAPRC